MKKLLPFLCILATAQALGGCSSRHETPLSPTPRDHAQPGTVQRLPDTYLRDPDYYTFAENESFWFLDLEKINTHNGRGTIRWTLDLPPDPEFGGVASPLGLAFDLDGTAYTFVNWFDFTPGHGKSQLARVDLSTGAVTSIGPPHYTSFSGMDFDRCGNLYATGFETGCPEGGDPIVFGDGILHRIDKYTGNTTPIGPTGKSNLMDVAFDSQDRLWGTVDNKLYLLDLGTGAATFVTEVTGVTGHGEVPGIPPEDWQYMELMSIAFDENDVLWGTAIRGCSPALGNSPVFTIDVGTGAATLVGYTGHPYNHGGDIRPSTVRIAHRSTSGYRCMSVSIDALAGHLAHGDYVPGTGGHGCDCP